MRPRPRDYLLKEEVGHDSGSFNQVHAWSAAASFATCFLVAVPFPRGSPSTKMLGFRTNIRKFPTKSYFYKCTSNFLNHQIPAALLPNTEKLAFLFPADLPMCEKRVTLAMIKVTNNCSAERYLAKTNELRAKTQQAILTSITCHLCISGTSSSTASMTI